jgi:hypothetical protein
MGRDFTKKENECDPALVSERGSASEFFDE